MIEALKPTGLLQDAHYALRAVRKDPGLLFFAVAIIGIGVGATTAAFSVLSPLLIKPLPFDDPDRLVWVANELGPDGDEGSLSAVTSRTQNLMDFRRLSNSFNGMTGYNAFFQEDGFNLSGDGEPERIAGVGVAQNLLQVLGVEPLLGRNFSKEEGEFGGPRAMILTHAFWRQRYAGDRDIVGTTVSLSGSATEVIGVLPSSFDFSSVFSPGTQVDFINIFPISAETDRWGNTLSMIARLKPEQTVQSAQAELDNIVANLKEADPNRWGLGATVTEMGKQISGPFRPALLLLMCSAIAVMLIVCVNLSNILLCKGLNRRKEMFLRGALGAPRGRLLRQMLIESMVLTTLGGILGTGLAIALTAAIAKSSAITIPLLRSVKVDASALAFTLITATIAGLLIGMLPALQASWAAGSSALRGAGRTISDSKNSRRLREVFVITEVAMACALLVIGGLLLQSFSKVLEVDIGFEPENAMAWQISTDRDFDTLAEQTLFYQQLADSVETVAGVTAVGMTDALPLGMNRQWSVSLPGTQFADGDDYRDVFPHIVDHRYLASMKIPLIAGRQLSRTDTTDTELVVLLNQSAASNLFPNQDPLGRIIKTNGRDFRVIGVAGDVRHVALESSSGMEMYLPFTQVGDFSKLDLVVRSQLSEEALAGGVATALRSVDPTIATNDVRTLESIVNLSVSPRRFTLLLLTAFAGIALLLAALGIYGVLSYSVIERRHEISIRMALGESAAMIGRRVVGRTLLLTTIGLVLGAAVSLLTTRFASSLLFGVEATNSALFVTITVVLFAVALIASWLPALRASRTDAMRALGSS